MFSFFKCVNCRICFKKIYHPVDWGQWYETEDDYYISRLISLKNKYEFEITSIKMQECISSKKSVICIKCKRHERVLIFSDFVNLCAGEIIEGSVSY